LPFTEYEEFQEDIPFRLFQFHQNLFEKIFPRWKVFGLGMDIDRKPRIFLKIPGLGQAVLVIFHEEGQGISGKQKERPALPFACREVPL
jgi:hypothetical protein